jgi:endonuclease/exonuclease/phosphatase family metal-dependent hydrolase
MLTVATYNLYLGADMSVVFGATSAADLAARARTVLDQVLATDFPGRAAVIARILVRERADVVGLQEVSRWSRGSGGDGAQRSAVWLDFLDELSEALAAAGAVYDVHACTPSFRGGATVPGEGEMSVQGHNVILVRRGSGLHVTAEGSSDFARTLDIATGMPEVVLNVARSWGWADLVAEGRPFRFVNTHLEAWDAAVRDAQRDELLAWLTDVEVPVVLVGDFNAPPEVVGMPRQYVDAWAAAGSGKGHTCGQTADLTGGNALAARIDYVWVRGLDVAGCRTAGDRAEDRTDAGLWPSDHAGVVAEVVTRDDDAAP